MHIYKRQKTFASNSHSKVITFRKYRHFSFLQQATFSRAEKYVSSLLLLSCRNSDLVKAQQSSQILSKSFAFSWKWKWEQEEQEAENLSSWIQDQSSLKRSRISSSSCIAEVELKEKKKKKTSDINDKNVNTLKYWTLTKRWSEKYFEQDSQIRKDLEQNSWLKE